MDGILTRPEKTKLPKKQIIKRKQTVTYKASAEHNTLITYSAPPFTTYRKRKRKRETAK